MKPKRSLLPIALAAIATLFGAFVSYTDPGDEIAKQLSRYTTLFPQEKVHLHIDRNYFVAGDTLNFKAYVVNAGNNHLSDTSRILYLTLTDAKGDYDTTLRYPLEGGTTAGTLAFANSLKTGTYTLSAYTNWMKNFSADQYYHTTLKIGNITGELPAPATAVGGDNPPNIYFFPEGGGLVQQLTSVVAFKALDKSGKGDNALGTIVDESGKTITTFRAAVAGMGRFSLKPEAGHTYTALVKFSNGATKKIALPAAAPSGYVLSVDNQDKNTIRVTIDHSSPQQQPVLVVAQANNTFISATLVTLTGNTATVLLPRRKFPTGIVQLTLFNPANQPVAERLVFVNRRDQLRLQLTPSGTKMQLEVTDALLNPVSAEFSVAITDQSKLSDTLRPPSIMADLLLTSDLKGNIENPDQYFSGKLPAADLPLDNLMLTQGWRRFVWKDVLAGNYPTINYPAEKEQLLSGTLNTAKGLPVPNTKIMLVSKTDSGFTTNVVTDSRGRFSFALPPLYGLQQFNLIAQGNGKNDIKIKLDEQSAPPTVATVSPFADADDQLKAYLAAKKALFPNGVSPQARQLQVVVVKAKQITAKEKALEASDNLNGKGNADQVLTYQDLQYCTNLEHCLPGRLTGVVFRTVLVDKIYRKVAYTNGNNRPMLIVLDGIPMPPNLTFLENTPAVNVQAIEVLRSGAKLAVYGMAASGGAILITTKRGGIDYNAINNPAGKTGGPASFAALTYNGYQKSREFYNPPPGSAAKVRSAETIFWKARVKTNEDGKALIEFAAAADVKKIAVVIEGISAEGKTGYLYKQQTLQ